MSDRQAANQQTVQFASFSDATGDQNVVVAAVTGKKIRVLSYTMNAAGALNTIAWQSASTALSGVFDYADMATVSAESEYGLFETAAGEALNITMTAAALVAGHVSYVLI